jgi:hypothetical protein
MPMAPKQPRAESAQPAEGTSQHSPERNSQALKRFSDAYARYCKLLTLAEQSYAAEDYPAAAALAQIAARYAYPADVGLFGSPRLERLLLALGKQIPVAPARDARHNGERARNVLHVLSYARHIGGDSRYAWRWIQQDTDSRHSVAITTQSDFKGVFEIPEVMRKAAEDSGGFLRALQAPTTNHLDLARELRELCQGMDVVVLHLFPYDIVPALALAAGCDTAKTLFINHSDHTFWAGSGVAHSIVHLRGQSDPFLRNRRGLDPGKSSILGIPLVHSPQTITKAEAKRQLGYAANVVLLLTIASPFKYSSPGRVGFLDLVVPVLKQFPQAVLIAVGPDSKGAWQAASIQTQGRIVPLGSRWDNDLLYAAADVYLDSVPFSSITSLLEAGIHGMPLLGCSPPDPELELLGPGAPGLDHTMEMANDVESYHNLLTRLITDEEFRDQSGQRIQTQILSLHTGRNWIQALNHAYARAEQTADRKCLIRADDVFIADGLNSALSELYRHPPSRPRALVGQYVGALPYRVRLPMTWRLYRIGFGLCFLNLLPPPADMIVRRAGRWMRKVLQQLLRLR